ncbi:MAG: HAMP domain-containing histidine kinase [Nocardioides sp.]|nr:HAMP domain-containing histidine kinase [Nocardioides sp.]
MSPRPIKGHWASLTSRLVITTVTLVALVALLIGFATTLAMRAHLTDQLDADVQSSLRRVGDSSTGSDSPPGLPGRLPDAPTRFDVRNQGPGTLIAVIPAETSRGDPLGEVLTDTPFNSRRLSSAALKELAGLPTDGDVHATDLPGEGSYRVTAVDAGSATLVTGLPTGDVDNAVASLVRWELLLGLLAVLTAGGAGFVVVRRQLRPLHDVAETAHRVAEQPLASGVIELTDRVPDHLTDEHTEVGRVGAALNTLLAHVESSLEARHRSEQQVRQFVGDASHELRTPLATIKGYAELARRRPGDAAAVLVALDKVEAESGRMTTVVEDLLLLARLDSARLDSGRLDSGRPLESAPVDLTRLLLEAVADARVLSPDHHWRLDLPESSDSEVLGDEQRLHQVVTNLLTNARKHTPAGSTITARARPGEVTISDDGPGFPPELVGSAFERFVRGDVARSRDDVGNEASGAGLGLSLVKAIIEAHGGTVALVSRPGDTRLTLRFPSPR